MQKYFKQNVSLTYSNNLSWKTSEKSWILIYERESRHNELKFPTFFAALLRERKDEQEQFPRWII